MRAPADEWDDPLAPPVRGISFNVKAETMTEVSDPDARAESEIGEAVAFADAAQYLAGGRADERSREPGREVLRENLTHRQAVEEYLADTV